MKNIYIYVLLAIAVILGCDDSKTDLLVIPQNSDQTADAVKVTNSTDISTSATTWLALTFDTEEIDTNNMHDATIDTSRLVAKSNGIYYITANIPFYANGSDGNRNLLISKNGFSGAHLAIVNKTTVSTTEPEYLETSVIAELEEDDYIELWVYTSSSDSVATSSSATSFSMVKLSDLKD